jgi:hypothetical protein
MANYIYPAPGVSNVEAVLKLKVTSNGSDTGLTIPSLQDITVNAANDTYTWTQMDVGSKLQIATTATNSLACNLVLNQSTFFGTTGSGGATAAELGIFGASTDKTLMTFSLYLGDESDGSAGKYLEGNGYITGLAPTVSADEPVWVSPVTISITGDYTVAASGSF